MENVGLAFDHFGLATRNPDRALSFLTGLGYQAGGMIYDPLQKVNLVLCLSADMPTVEVIFPSEECGPLSAILADRSESLYHLCYRSHDLRTSLAAIKQAGHRLIEVAAPQPAVLFDNKPVSFYLVKGFGLIEIIEG